MMDLVCIWISFSDAFKTKGKSSLMIEVSKDIFADAHYEETVVSRSPANRTVNQSGVRFIDIIILPLSWKVLVVMSLEYFSL